MGPLKRVLLRSGNSFCLSFCDASFTVKCSREEDAVEKISRQLEKEGEAVEAVNAKLEKLLLNMEQQTRDAERQRREDQAKIETLIQQLSYITFILKYLLLQHFLKEF